MSTILRDQSIINAGCTPISKVYWRIINMDTDVDILATSNGDPATSIVGLHDAFVDGTYLEPEINFAFFNGVAIKIKLVKHVKDSCGNLSPGFEMIFSADVTTGNFEMECEGTSIAFAKQVQEYTEAYPDDSEIELDNVPIAGSLNVFKNNSQILIEDTHFSIAGTTVTIASGSTDPSPSDKDVYIIQYAYQT